jgi:hypothetical protein
MHPFAGLRCKPHAQVAGAAGHHQKLIAASAKDGVGGFVQSLFHRLLFYASKLRASFDTSCQKVESFFEENENILGDHEANILSVLVFVKYFGEKM